MKTIKHELNLDLLNQSGFVEKQETFDMDNTDFLTEEKVKKGIAIASEIFKDIDNQIIKTST